MRVLLILGRILFEGYVWLMKIEDNRNYAGRELVKKCLPMAVALVPLTVAPQAVNAQVSIIVSGTVDLNFGSVTAGATGGTVTISTAGARTRTGSVTLLAGAGLESAGVLSISGSTGVLIDVSMTAGGFTVDDAGAGVPMTVNAFDIDGGGATVSVTLSTNPATFPLGATLTVAAGQAAGVYSGAYTVNANYQ